MLTTIDFMRHGEVAGGSYYRGRTDDPLTKRGWQQMYQTVASRSWDQIGFKLVLSCHHYLSSFEIGIYYHALFRERHCHL